MARRSPEAPRRRAEYCETSTLFLVAAVGFGEPDSLGEISDLPPPASIMLSHRATE